MKSFTRRVLAGSALAASLGTASGQTPSATLDSYVSEAKVAARTDWAGTFLRLCVPPPTAAQGGRGAGRGGVRATPARETWYAAPEKVADNLYFLGTRAHSSWAVAGSEGIIIIEALF